MSAINVAGDIARIILHVLYGVMLTLQFSGLASYMK